MRRDLPPVWACLLWVAMAAALALSALVRRWLGGES